MFYHVLEVALLVISSIGVSFDREEDVKRRAFLLL